MTRVRPTLKLGNSVYLRSVAKMALEAVLRRVEHCWPFLTRVMPV